MTENLEQVIYVSWEESERGWGTRPDGCSLHLKREDFQVHLDNYWDKMPDEAPDEYSRPAGTPVAVSVGLRLYARIKETKHGLDMGPVEERELVSSGELVYGSQRSGWV